MMNLLIVCCCSSLVGVVFFGRGVFAGRLVCIDGWLGVGLQRVGSMGGWELVHKGQVRWWLGLVHMGTGVT